MLSVIPCCYYLVLPRSLALCGFVKVGFFSEVVTASTAVENAGLLRVRKFVCMHSAIPCCYYLVL